MLSLFTELPGMPKKGQVTETIFARGISHLAPTINAIAENHRILPPDLTRGLLDAACKFYEEHGWFSFPVKITPIAFQTNSVEENQALYGTRKTSSNRVAREAQAKR